MRPVAACLAASACLAAIGLGAGLPQAQGATLPSGFKDTPVIEGGELEEPTVVRFAADGRVFVAEKSGKILVYDGIGDTTPELFADLRTEVYDNGDRGLLGLALDPKFTEGRPYVYALYTYDHILGETAPAPKWGEAEHTGDACPLPEGAGVDACPVSGRLVRLTAEEGTDHAVEEEGDPLEDVLVEGWCQQFSSHSIGDLEFDASGALYASGGDGANFTSTDYGQSGWPHPNECGDPPGNLAEVEAGASEPLEPPDAEGGALRAQDARTPSDPFDPQADPTGLNGSLIRIDPESGEGLPGNPMYGSLDANERRIVAYGFRNPFRFAIDPASGEIFVGNVGWGTYEEIDRFTTTASDAYNSGWPCYEGPERTSGYKDLGLNLCEGLYDEPGSTSQPFLYYNHSAGVSAEDPCPTEDGSLVAGPEFYDGAAFPSAYDGALFFSDPVRGCLYVMLADGEGQLDPSTVRPFLVGASGYPGIDIEVGPEGDLYYVSIFGGEDGSGAINRISYDPGAPTARLTASPRWGESPLIVHLDAAGSEDPDGETLSYEWDLDGDGTFEAPGGAEMTETYGGTENVTVGVRVSDETGAHSVARVTLYPGDTPPRPEIDEPDEGLEWRVGEQIEFDGFAKDDEDDVGGQEELPAPDLYWKTRLYHCPSACHAHPLQVFPSVYSGTFTAPDHDYPSHIEVSLTATDSRGLSATDVVNIQPRAVELSLASEPAGIALSAGLRTEAAPFELPVIQGSNVTLTAPASATVGGTAYEWLGWSDGGARSHTIAAAAPGTYIAQYTATGGGSGGETSGGGSVSSPPPSSSPGGGQGQGPPAPNVRIGAHPAKRTRGRTARFVFSSSVSGARFRCRVDLAAFRACSSPLVLRHLHPGRHTVEVGAVGPTGLVDPTPAVFGWTVLRR